MIKKFKAIYPEEEILDGFSILCFDSQKKLEKFSSSLNKTFQRMILNEINRSKTDPIINTNISPTNHHISVIKHKLTSTPISPTRITAQRKSKPDINALTLAICSNKRRAQSASPVKGLDSKLCCIEEDRKTADKENEDINEKVLPIVVQTCEEKLKDIQQDPCHPINEYYASSNKDESIFADSSKNATSTLSPVSIQQANGLTGDVESMDLNSPYKVDPDPIDIINNVISIMQESLNDNAPPKNQELDVSVTKDCNNNQECVVNPNPDDFSDNKIDDDCVITSIGFDPSPKLSGITLSSVEHLLLDIPKLKPAPPFICPPSIKTILLQNYQKSPPPPPLVPAPAYYFLSNLLVYKTKPSQNTSNKCISHKSIVSPKLKSPKRCIMKSSILKSSAKCVKLSTVKMSKTDSKPTNGYENLQNPVVRSILQNTPQPNSKLYSLNPIKTSTVTSIGAPLNNCKTIINKSNIQNINVSSAKKVSKTGLNSQIIPKLDHRKKLGLLNNKNFGKQSIIRKTKTQVDICHWISKNINNNVDFKRSHLLSDLIHKPKALGTPYRPYIPINQIPTVNPTANIISDTITHLSYNNKYKLGQYRLQNKLISSNNIRFKQHRNDQVFIRPLNTINTNFSSTNTVFLSSASHNSINYCSRPNILLLQ